MPKLSKLESHRRSVCPHHHGRRFHENKSYDSDYNAVVELIRLTAIAVAQMAIKTMMSINGYVKVSPYISESSRATRALCRRSMLLPRFLNMMTSCLFSPKPEIVATVSSIWQPARRNCQPSRRSSNGSLVGSTSLTQPPLHKVKRGATAGFPQATSTKLIKLTGTSKDDTTKSFLQVRYD